MTEDRGLSIFDEEQPTEAPPPQVMPTVDPAEPVAQPTTEAPAHPVARPAAAPATTGAVPRSAEAPVVPPRSPAGAPDLPLVRRGGYDKDAVDRHLRTVAAEKAGLLASINEAQGKLKVLEAQVSELRQKLAENETPSYAGLGGKASEMLRLAEEQAEDVLHDAKVQAAEVRNQAAREA